MVVIRNGKQEEAAAVRQLFAAPSTPDARKLLAAVPQLGIAPERPMPSRAVDVVKVVGLSMRFPMRGGVLDRVTTRVHAVENVSFRVVPSETAPVVIGIQNTCVEPKDDPAEATRRAPLFARMREVVIPNTPALQDWARVSGVEVIHTRIAGQTLDGRDRAQSQKKPGFKYPLLPKDREDSHIVQAVSPEGDEIGVSKTTDFVLTGTNLRLILHKMGIKRIIVAGIFTDQCISSALRSLADESFNEVVEECCAAATEALHRHELTAINMNDGDVVGSDEVKTFPA